MQYIMPIIYYHYVFSEHKHNEVISSSTIMTTRLY
jgi:hypothetical protein